MNSLNLFLQEWKTLRQFSSPACRETARLVFYSEHAAYGKFYAPVLAKLQDAAPFSFLTSDPQDPVLNLAPGPLQAYYIKSLLGGLLPQLEARALVMTMPDIEQYHIKRSRKGTEHIYFFHALVSTHMIYRKGAFDHYDTVLCVGPHHVTEIRQTEKIYGLNPKKLVNAGYPLLDKIYSDYQAYAAVKTANSSEAPLALIAPSWAPSNIMLSCLEPLVKSLKDKGFRIVIRPHPEFIKRCPKELAQLKGKPDFSENVEFEIYPRQESSVFEAEVLVTDWSGIALEYAFGTERPVLFIDTPRKVLNAEYEKIESMPVEVALRDRLGCRLSPALIRDAGGCALKLLETRGQYQREIQSQRQTAVFNFGRSSQVIADYLKEFFR